MDNTEKINVEVDGAAASEGFNRIKAAAQAADDALNSTAKAADNVDQALDRLLGINKKTADGFKDTGKAAEDAGRGIDRASSSAEKGVSKFEELQKSLFSAGRSAFTLIWDKASEGITRAIGFADSFIDRIASVQRTISLLQNLPGVNVKEEYQYLIDLANKYGLSLQTIQQDYAKYSLSAEGSSMTNLTVKRTFEQVSIAVRALHMNQQQAQFSFLALEQMLSKGQVSMEEFRRQFAQRIPGAMQATARELGVTTPQLLNFIQKVGAASDKLMPYIGNAIQRLYQGGIQNAISALDAERNRIETSITDFFRKILDAGGAEGMSTLLRSINSLLKTDTIAQVFANAMNLITTKIAMFVASLTSKDIEEYGKKILDFLTSLTTLAMAAGNAIAWLGKHTGVLGGILGFLGAGSVANMLPIPPWAKLAIMGLGAAGGAAYGANVGNNTFGDPGARVAANNVEIGKLQNSLDNPTAGDKFNKLMMPGAAARFEDETRSKMNALKTENAQLEKAMGMVKAQIDFVGPELPPIIDMQRGTDKQIQDYLNKVLGTGKPNKKDEQLALRQKNFVEDLEARARAVLNPDEDRFAKTMTDATQLGLAGKLMERTKAAVDILQGAFNTAKLKAEEDKERAMIAQLDKMSISANADMAKFREQFSVDKLHQIDEQEWVTKTRQLQSELNKVLEEQKKKWDEMNVTSKGRFALEFDIEGNLDKLRKSGDAYIAEYRRIEQEKRTILGGEKSFLKEWNDQATDFGKITYNFLKGVTDNTIDMLAVMVTTGHMSFAKLTEFVIQYIVKLLLVQALTPFINWAVGGLTSAFGSIMGIGSSMGSSMYSLSTGSSGLGLKLPGKASGGPVDAGKTYMVGERGPEIVTFGRAGFVHPNEVFQGGGGDTTTINVSVDSNGSSANASGDKADLGRKIGDAVRAVLVNERRPGGLLA